MGYPPKLDQEEPAVVAAIERILTTAKDAGLRAGIHCLAPSYAKKMIALGFDLVTLGNDIRILATATASVIEETRS